NSDDLEEYKKFAPLDKPIKEYGASGAKEIEAESNSNNIISVKLNNDSDFGTFKNTYKGKDFVAIHNADGSINAYVREKDTKEMADEVKKKSSTADLLREANEFAEEKEQSLDIDPMIEIEEEQLIDR
ncbi:MAG: hypothetical protein IJA30_07690, partial [Bacilli bacterium]|nr:hypothetical protein [Bacilli bacterium]